MPRRKRETLEVTHEEQVGAFGTVRLDLEIDYTVEAYRPAVTNADPNDCHPAEGGVVDVDEIRCRSIALVLEGDETGLAWEAGDDLDPFVAKAAVAWFADELGDDTIRELCEEHEEHEALYGGTPT